MENLKWLRQINNLSLRELEKYTGMSNVSLSRMESGKQGLNNKTLTLLAKFYWVSTDFLMDKTDYGIYALNYDAEVQTLSISQYSNAYTHISVSIRADEKGKYSVFRKLDEAYSNSNQMKVDKIIEQLKKMNDEQIDKTEKFIDEYILK